MIENNLNIKNEESCNLDSGSCEELKDIFLEQLEKNNLDFFVSNFVSLEKYLRMKEELNNLNNDYEKFAQKYSDDDLSFFSLLEDVDNGKFDYEQKIKREILEREYNIVFNNGEFNDKYTEIRSDRVRLLSRIKIEKMQNYNNDDDMIHYLGNLRWYGEVKKTIEEKKMSQKEIINLCGNDFDLYEYFSNHDESLLSCEEIYYISDAIAKEMNLRFLVDKERGFALYGELLEKADDVKNKKEKRENISKIIESIIIKHDSAKDEGSSLVALLSELALLKERYGFYKIAWNEKLEHEASILSSHTDFSFDQNQVAMIVDSFEKNIGKLKKEDVDLCRKKFISIFSIYLNSHNEEEKVVSDLLAEDVISRINNNQDFSDDFNECQKEWLFKTGKLINHETYLQLIVGLVKNRKYTNDYISHVFDQIREYQHISLNRGDASEGFYYQCKRDLKRLGDEINIYLVKNEINHVLESPLNDIPIEEKRQFLSENWNVLMRPEYFYDTILSSPTIRRSGFMDPREVYWFTPEKCTIEDVEKIFRSASLIDSEHLSHVEKKRRIEKYADVEADKSFKQLVNSSNLALMKPFKGYYAKCNSSGYVYDFFKPKLENGKKDIINKSGSLFNEDVDFLSLEDVLKIEGYKNDLIGSDFDNLIYNFEFLTELQTREKIEKDFGIELKEFALREQFQFIVFLSSQTVEDVVGIKSFLSQGNLRDSKTNRIKSFLSLELDSTMSDKILSIGENTKNNPGLADKIFAKYAEIVGDAYGIEERVRGEFDKKDIGKDELAIISRSLLEKGKGILEEYADRLADGKEIDEQQILNDLDSCKADLLLTASIWKGIDKDSVKLEDLKGVTFERYTTDKLAEMPNVFRLVREAVSVDGVIMSAIHAQSVKSSINSYENEASEEEKQRAQEIIEMIRIYQKNYENYPELRDKIVPGFLEKLESGRGDIAIYLYKKDGKVMAFNRFDDNGDGTKYFGSCNVDPTLSGSAIGGALVRETLEREASGAQKIKGDCIPNLPISSYYVEDSGFIATGITKDYGGTGVDLMQIERVAENGKYYYRDKEIDIVGAYKDNPDNKLKTDEPRFVLKYKIGSEDLNRAFEELVPKDYVMTRYCFDKESGEVYCGFERRV